MTLIARLTAAEDAVAEYPVSLRRLKELFPTVGWTDPPKLATVARVGLVVVERTGRPTARHGQTVREGPPERDARDNVWRQTWIVEDPNPARIEALKTGFAEEAREEAGRQIMLAIADQQEVDLSAIPAVTAIQAKLAEAKMKIEAGTLDEAAAAVEEVRNGPR